MNILRFSRHMSLLGLFLSLASCDPGPQAGGGIGGTGSIATVSSGPVTKFGSVFVSGTEYDNSNTIYCIDDDPCSSENRLKLGMVVLVNGTVTDEYSTGQPITRVADTISFEESVEGVVQSVAQDGLSLIVLGQVVHLDQKTVIDSSIPGQSINPGDRIEVSGFVVGDGHILATLITMHTGTPHYEVQGTIKNHDVTAQTFEIGALEVRYSTADIGQMPPLAPSHSLTWNGLVVHVRGDHWSQGGTGPYGARLTATRVKPIGLGVESSPEAEVEGVILHVDAPGNFLVNNLRVQTTASTILEGGTVNDLVVGSHIDIHGHLIGGVLQAERISFEGEVELAAYVESIDTASRSLTLYGLAGMTVHIDNRTAIEGENDLRRFEDIAIGDRLKIHGRPAGGNRLLAVELERSGPTTEVKFEGFVRSAADPLLVILGATIDTSGIPDNRFIGTDGRAIGRSAFFPGLPAGHSVSLKGSWTGSGVTWTSVRLKQ
jgi:Domain of unknown function (DUF5666)